MHSRLREVYDPLTWIYCYLAYVAAKIDHRETRDLLAYGLIVLHLARKHEGRGWITYDQLFRQQAAAGSPMIWTELNSSLMAATVLGYGGDSNPPGRSCSLCLASDHKRPEFCRAISAVVKPTITPGLQSC